jgi:hypothetical protein
MGRPKTDVDLHKHTLNLRQGDMEALAALFPKHHPSVMVRKIVSKFVDQVQQVPEEQVPPTDISL